MTLAPGALTIGSYTIHDDFTSVTQGPYVDLIPQALDDLELVHAGPLVAQGYWQDPERTAERFRPAPARDAREVAEWRKQLLLARFTGKPGLRFKTWRMRPGEWFEGTYVWENGVMTDLGTLGGGAEYALHADRIQAHHRAAVSATVPATQEPSS